MIIDCHGRYTTVPKELEEYRKRQIAGLKDSTQVAARGVRKVYSRLKARRGHPWK